MNNIIPIPLKFNLIAWIYFALNVDRQNLFRTDKYPLNNQFLCQNLQKLRFSFLPFYNYNDKSDYLRCIALMYPEATRELGNLHTLREGLDARPIDFMSRRCMCNMACPPDKGVYFKTIFSYFSTITYGKMASPPDKGAHFKTIFSYFTTTINGNMASPPDKDAYFKTIFLISQPQYTNMQLVA